jgi:tRNA threonylcarbamoyladenosine biosynthesis protein TsaE
MKKEVLCKNETETMELALQIGKKAAAGDIICLEGELGAGKTHFVKGFVKAFGIDPALVSSPTFSIINEYEGGMPVYHFDCYRLENPQEALEIGAEEYLYGEGVSIIEWPERIRHILPDEVMWIEITTVNNTTRKISYIE